LGGGYLWSEICFRVVSGRKRVQKQKAFNREGRKGIAKIAKKDVHIPHIELGFQ